MTKLAIFCWRLSLFSGSADEAILEATQYRCRVSSGSGSSTSVGSSGLGRATVVTVVGEPFAIGFRGEVSPDYAEARLYPELDRDDFDRMEPSEGSDDWLSGFAHVESLDLGDLSGVAPGLMAGPGEYTLAVFALWEGDIEASILYGVHLRFELEPISNLRYSWGRHIDPGELGCCGRGGSLQRVLR